MSATTTIEHGLLQGDLDANNKTILNLDLTGLGLTKASVGLGNVDNTSDLNKPISTATQTALNLKENAFAAGTTDQFFIGNKTWLDYGALALQDGVTTLPLISVTALAADGYATLEAVRTDSVAKVKLTHIGASVAGNILTGLPAANVGLLAFEGCSYGVINTLNSAPLVFGVNNTKRMRLGSGLSVGTDTEAGAGCILATGTITGDLVGDGSGITGLVKNQIPGTLNATIVPRLTINGVGGAGYVLLGVQTSNPAIASPHIFGTSGGRVTLGHSGSNSHAMSFDNGQLTGDCIYQFPNVAFSTLVPRVAVPAAVGSAGVAGSIAFDSTHFYGCPVANTWRRVAWAAF